MTLSPQHKRLGTTIQGVAWSLALISPLLLIVRFGTETLYWDDWRLVPLVGEWQAGRFGIGDLWARHNEHRMVVPFLLFGVLAGNGVGAKGLLAIHVGSAWALFGLLWLRARELPTEAKPSVVLAAAILLFSWGPWINWVWAWQAQLWLLCLFAAAALHLAQTRATLLRSVAAVLLGLGACWSHGAGLCVWPLLWISRHARESHRARTLFGAGTLAAIASYATLAQRSGLEPPAVSGFLSFARDLLASPLVVGWPAPSWFRFVLVVLGLALTARELHRTFRVAPRGLGFWPSMALLGLLQVVLVSIGRATSGEDPLAGRYTLFGTMFWLGVLGSIASSKWKAPPEDDVLSLSSRRAQPAWLAVGSLLAVAALAVVSSRAAIPELQHQERERLFASGMLRSGEVPENFSTVVLPELDLLRRWLPYACSLRMGPFHVIPSAAPLQCDALLASDARAGNETSERGPVPALWPEPDRDGDVGGTARESFLRLPNGTMAPLTDEVECSFDLIPRGERLCARGWAAHEEFGWPATRVWLQIEPRAASASESTPNDSPATRDTWLASNTGEFRERLEHPSGFGWAKSSGFSLCWSPSEPSRANSISEDPPQVVAIAVVAGEAGRCVGRRRVPDR